MATRRTSRDRGDPTAGRLPLRSHGWGTYAIDYRPGAQSLTDVLSAYDALRHRIGPSKPICVWGSSAGGHLALLLAAHRPRINCAIAEGGPTDFLTYTAEPAYAPAGVSPETGPTWIMNSFITRSFGATPGALWKWSPLRLASRIRAKMLLGASTFDEFLPSEQLWEMHAARPDLTHVMVLAGSTLSPQNFTHASITPAALVSWQTAELKLLRDAG